MTRTWQFAALILVAAVGALAIRLPRLNLRPMHTDEAVHAVKCDALWTTGRYVYDGRDYHGPTLNYFTLPSLWLSGAKDFAGTTEAVFRVVPVVFGGGLVLLLLWMGAGLGRSAAAWAALLTALSPAMVFYSRYYIQEIPLAFFTFGVILAGWRYARTGRVAWALAAGACLGLMHATKETCIIAWGAMAAALIGVMLWSRWADEPATPTSRPPVLTLRAIGAGVAAGMVVSVLCYSSFFTNLSGPADSVMALVPYVTRAGGESIHIHPWHYYLATLLYTHYSPGPVWTEAMIPLLALVGAAAVVTRRGIAGADTGLVRFLVLYTVLMAGIYSAIPYKTPWCMVQFLQPMILLAGVGAAALVRAAGSVPARAVVCALLAVGASHLGRQAQAADLRYYADNRNPYVYAQPVNDVKRLADRIERLAAVHPDGRRMLVKAISPHPWPLPWYLRRMERVGYWEEPPEDPHAPVVIVTSDLQPTLDPHIYEGYHTSHYGMRPGVVMLVYVDRALWDEFARRLTTPASDGRATR